MFEESEYVKLLQLILWLENSHIKFKYLYNYILVRRY